MNKLFLLLLLLLSLVSCRPKDKAIYECKYRSESLFKVFDSSMFDTRNYEKDSFFEVLDKGSRDGTRGIYKFDANKNLRFYGFLLSDSNDYIFSRHYDSSGKIIEKTGNEVVQWYFRRLSNDSIKITFYLFCKDDMYSDVAINIGSTRKIAINLFKSPIFSNIEGGNLVIVLPKKTRMIYIRGTKKDICLGKESEFVDSIQVPSELITGNG